MGRHSCVYYCPCRLGALVTSRAPGKHENTSDLNSDVLANQRVPKQLAYGGGCVAARLVGSRPPALLAGTGLAAQTGSDSRAPHLIPHHMRQLGTNRARWDPTAAVMVGHARRAYGRPEYCRDRKVFASLRRQSPAARWRWADRHRLNRSRTQDAVYWPSRLLALKSRQRGWITFLASCNSTASLPHGPGSWDVRRPLRVLTRPQRHPARWCCHFAGSLIPG